MTPLQKLPKNVGDLGKFIVAKGFKELPEIQYIAKSGHTANYLPLRYHKISSLLLTVILPPTDECSLNNPMSKNNNSEYLLPLWPMTANKGQQESEI